MAKTTLAIIDVINSHHFYGMFRPVIHADRSLRIAVFFICDFWSMIGHADL